MTALNISAAIMPDTRRGLKEQLMQKDLPEEVTLLSLIVKAEHREALRLLLVHPGIEIDQPLIKMITMRPVVAQQTHAKSSRQEQTIAQNQKPTKEEEQE